MRHPPESAYLGGYERNLGTVQAPTDVPTKYYVANFGTVSRLVAFRKNGTLYYVGTDHLGGTIRVADASFNPLDQMRYTPFGVPRDQGTNLDTDHLFTSQVQDQSIGLYWYASRAYDPALGRFCGPDTIVPLKVGSIKTLESRADNAKAWRDGKWEEVVIPNPQLLNRYSFRGNNPQTYVDPSGHIVWFAVGIGLFVGAAVGGLGYVIGSEITGHQMNLSEAEVAVGVGAAAGALAPIVATTAVGAILLGAGATLTQYALTQVVDNAPIDPGTAWLSAVVGGATGAAVGPVNGRTLAEMARYRMQSPSDVESLLRSSYNWDYVFQQAEQLPRAAFGSALSNLDLQKTLDWIDRLIGFRRSQAAGYSADQSSLTVNPGDL